MNVDQATRRRLSEIAELWEMGVTEHTGRAMRTSQEEGGEATGRRFRGLKHAYPELYNLQETPQAIAGAITRGHGPAYDRVYETVRDEMVREGFEPTRKRSPGRPTVPPHEALRHCQHCGVYHAKGQHRFHGKGAFHRTHLFSFGANPMTLARAKAEFRDLMAKAREGRLTEADRGKLRTASQIIRYSSRRTAKHNVPPRSAHRRFTFGQASIGSVFEFYQEDLPRGPWRKVGETSFQLATGRGQVYQVQKTARIRAVEPGLFSAGPLFEGNQPKSRFSGRFLPKSQWTKAELRSGGKSRRRRRPPAPPVRRTRARARRNAPAPQKGERYIRMGQVVEVRYKRDHGAKPGYYKHTFKRGATLYYDSKLDRVFFE